MSASSAAHREGVSFVAVTGPLADWGVRAALVSRVLARSEWSGDPPLDVAALLGIIPTLEEQEERVIVLTGAAVGVALRVRAPMRLRSCPIESLLRIPELVWADAGAPRLIHELAIVESDRPLLVLAPQAVAALARESTPDRPRDPP